MMPKLPTTRYTRDMEDVDSVRAGSLWDTITNANEEAVSIAIMTILDEEDFLYNGAVCRQSGNRRQEIYAFRSQLQLLRCR